jgi:hypothetical protein
MDFGKVFKLAAWARAIGLKSQVYPMCGVIDWIRKKPVTYVTICIEINDAIQATPRDSLKVAIGPMTIFRAKRFKEVFNRLIQDT